MFTRRTILKGGLYAAAASVLKTPLSFAAAADGPAGIDREALVKRHFVTRTRSAARSPLQVGNGKFAFGADVTGLQTFVPFNTMSEWGWHKTPLPDGLTEKDKTYEDWDSGGRKVAYESSDPAHPALGRWGYANPSRINLARIGLKLTKADGGAAAESDLKDVSQTLDLWTGTLRSRFTLDGDVVNVTTACHPDADVLAIRIDSPAVAAGRVSVFVNFPAPDGREFGDDIGTPDPDGRFPTVVTAQAAGRLHLERQLHQDRYHVAMVSPDATFHTPAKNGDLPAVKIVRARYGADAGWLDVTQKVAELSPAGVQVSNQTFGQDPAFGRVKRLEITYTLAGVEHTEQAGENETWLPAAAVALKQFRVDSKNNSLAFVVAFSPEAVDAKTVPDATAVFAACEKHWPAFWQTGGAIDLSDSTDPRWRELERRVVLSQYLMAVNEAGTLPPQESGLVNNGWFGKFHMEMYWWHAAHYALWNRWPALDLSSSVYERMLPTARARADRQQYAGARWTKMSGPDFTNATHPCNATLVWQQPHPMFFAELEYRARPTPETLKKWETVLHEAAAFMTTYVIFNEETKQYDIGPPLYIVSENTDPRASRNPAFELSYWRFGLRLAQTWRERLGQPREPAWDNVLKNLAPLPVQDGLYVTHEGITDMWTKFNFEHPALTGVYGWLPGDGVDVATMQKTLDQVLKTWRMDAIWGWDLPMLAMCAARLGRPEQAIDLLLEHPDRFGFDDAGLSTGGPYPYFPSNGGLLYAVALMAAGWDGSAEEKSAPGFPAAWGVKSEGLSKAL